MGESFIFGITQIDYDLQRNRVWTYAKGNVAAADVFVALLGGPSDRERTAMGFNDFFRPGVLWTHYAPGDFEE